jgi:hypothetical protein
MRRGEQPGCILGAPRSDQARAVGCLPNPMPMPDRCDGRSLHRESLLHVPLLAQSLDDPAFAVVRRGIDSRWKYEDVIATRLDGFNPLRSAAFIGAHSRLDRWLPHRHGSARPFNQGDELVSEALFVAHDYLHVWTYHWVDALCPELGFGHAPITSRNFEDMVFCHILSEAVATVGLDYWYLSNVDLSDVVPIGTLQKGLTVSYRTAWQGEYHRFNPQLNVQHPSFLGQLTRFYCGGVFVGFGVEDMRSSPAIDAWLTHELRYGQLQRRYCRQWLAYLSHDDIKLSESRLDAPVAWGASWKKRLTAELSDRLWAKVKHGEMCSPGARQDADRTWSAPARRQPDFRFLNLNRCPMPSPAAVKAMPDESFEYLLRQYVARFDYESFPEEALGVFTLIRDERDFSIGDRLLKGIKRLPAAPSEPRDLFLYN